MNMPKRLPGVRALFGMRGYTTCMEYTAMLRQRPGNFVHLLCGNGARWRPLAEMASRIDSTTESAAIAAWPTMRMPERFSRIRAASPLAQRGWVLQEELLSIRIISWSNHGASWSCLESETAEGGHM